MPGDDDAVRSALEALTNSAERGSAQGLEGNLLALAVDAARAKGRKDVIAHGMLMMAYLGRVLTGFVPQDKILSYLEVGKQEGAQVLCGGAAANVGADLAGGYYIQPTLFKGHNKMRVFQEEIFGPVLAVTTFKDEAEALAIANDTLYGLGAGVWSRNGNVAYRMGRAIKAGRVWTNCYHAYPAHAAFGGYKESGIGRETHKAMLDHYQQTKNLLVSYSPNALGFF